MQPLISFCIPCYNVADYLDKAVQSILDGAAAAQLSDQVEILLIDDTSTDGATPQAVDAWQERVPQTVRAFHHPTNRGHGGGIATGLKEAHGHYFKVLDADDWFDTAALAQVLERLSQVDVDMFLANYVYEKPSEGSQRVISYHHVLPVGIIFAWADVGSFKPWQNILMHSVIYRTELAQAALPDIPLNTFYVDNIFVYVPLPQVKTMYYLDVDLYRYFIGREGQSVQEDVMASRIDQQLKVTRFMIDAFDVAACDLPERLRDYLIDYLRMMVVVSNVFLILNGRPGLDQERTALWAYLAEHAPLTYPLIYHSTIGRALRKLGHAQIIAAYHLANKAFHFN